MTRFALALLLFAACSSQPKVRTERDDSYSFAGHKTFGWLPLRDSGDDRIDDAALAKNVRAAVTRELTAKGYTFVADGQPDFRVGHLAILLERSSVNAEEPGAGYGSYGGGGAAGPEYVYYDATLVLEVKDGAGGPVVWSSTAKAAAFVTARKRERRRRTEDAVRRMLAAFPAR